MASIKVYQLGGLDKKSNDLTRDFHKASSMINMEYDTQSTLRKRPGYEWVADVLNYDQMIYYPSKDEKLFFRHNSSEVYVIGDGYSKTLTMPFTLGSCDISHCENTTNLYLTTNDYSIPVMKYDGSNIYRAGLPTPRQANDAAVTVTSGTGTTGTKIYYSFKDINGLTVYSPISESALVSGSSVINFYNALNDSSFSEKGFYSRYCNIDDTSTFGQQIILNGTPTERTIITHSNNYVEGDKFLFDTENTRISMLSGGGFVGGFKVLEVEFADSTHIRFKPLIDNVISIVVGPVGILPSGYTYYQLDCKLKINVFREVSSSGVFIKYFTAPIDQSVALNTHNCGDMWNYGQNILGSSIGGSPFATVYLEDLYNTSTSKIMPPYCKYVASYGDQIVYGNIESYIGFDNKKIRYNNDDLIIYSDILTGDCCENTSEFNRQKIGETYDGQITGLTRCNDSVVVFKDKSTFTLDGVLAQGQYSLRKINTNGIGCTYHRSILPADEGVYFQANNGIYFTNGIQVKRISQELDYKFQDGLKYTTQSCRMRKRQKAIFYVEENTEMVVVDYYYGQVYIWEGINPSKGIHETADGDAFFYDGSALYRFYAFESNAGIYSDNGSPIYSEYATTWHHCGEPSLRKKFTQLRVFNLTDDQFKLNIDIQKDWDITTKQSLSRDIGVDSQTEQFMIDMQTARSLRVVFSNNELNQNMVLTGYEITFEPYNVRDKN